MQLSDGGWGWFSGCGEHSWPHTTAVVVHGLQLAKQNDVALPPGMLERGVDWLKNYQAEQVQLLQNAADQDQALEGTRRQPRRLGLHGAGRRRRRRTTTMRDFLYRDRTHLAVYAKAMFGLALHKQQQAEKLA